VRVKSEKGVWVQGWENEVGHRWTKALAGGNYRALKVANIKVRARHQHLFKDSLDVRPSIFRKGGPKRTAVGRNLKHRETVMGDEGVYIVVLQIARLGVETCSFASI